VGVEWWLTRWNVLVGTRLCCWLEASRLGVLFKLRLGVVVMGERLELVGVLKKE
jgi:hypothetical protein